MRFLRHGEIGRERSGVLVGGTARDTSAFGEDYDESFFANEGPSRLARWLAHYPNEATPVDKQTRLGPPICRPSKILCIGLNYLAHARQFGMAPPESPLLVYKSTSALCGANDPVILPKGSQQTDWEVELAVVIGKAASNIDAAEAANHIAGYLAHNDITERSYPGGDASQWIKGKGCDSFAPMGPYLVTPDEIPDPGRLRLWLNVNGRRYQNASTAEMLFTIPYLISYISHYMTLLPGDVISTGSPAGVGYAEKPQRFLNPGDDLEWGVEGLGSARQVVTQK